MLEKSKEVLENRGRFAGYSKMLEMLAWLQMPGKKIACCG